MAASTLHEAAREGDVDAVLAFLSSNPASVNARDRHSRTWAGHEEIVKVLCEKNADVGAAALDDMAAIHFASQKGHILSVRFLLAAGASIKARTRKGMTPLHYAVQGGHTDLIKLLVKRGASLSAENKAGKKPMDMTKDQSIVELIERTDVERRLQKGVKEKGVVVSSFEEPEKETLSSEIDQKVRSPAHAGTISDSHNCNRRRIDDSLITETDIHAEACGPKSKKSKISLSHLLQDYDAEDEMA